MISVSEAKALITHHIERLQPVMLSLKDASGHILAADVKAICDIPAFRQSSMDGYALRFEDKDEPLFIRGEMAAGTAVPLHIGKGEAVRIFTGAPVPDGADTVVMQEKIALADGLLLVQDEKLSPGMNVRAQGAEVKTDALAIEKGSLLSPAAIGFLAGIGITRVLVFPMPAVAIIATGKELQQAGEKLSYGQVYESNSYALSAALRLAGIKSIELYTADDDLLILTKVLEKALLHSDLVLLTGGVSVGDYDFVIEASRLCGIEQVFHKVKQKPGKPLFFGKLQEKVIFGLPGNPSSVMNCFYNYVLPAVAQLSARKNSVRVVKAVLQATYQKPAGLTHFLKGIYENGEALPLNAQESFRLSSFASANCLICLEEDQEKVEKGETVNILLLPE